MVQSFILLLLFLALAHGDHRSGQRWARTARSFKLGVIKSVTNSGPNDWLGNWDWAIDSWSQSKVLDLVTVRGATDYQTRLDCPAREGYIRVCNNDYGRTSWRGMARWSFQLYDGKPGLIYQCTVRLNDRTDTDYERKWLGHEIGHCLGLDHTSTSGQSDNSVMDYSVAPTSIGPSPKDLAVLESVYSDIDWFDSAARLDPLTCPPSKLAQVAAACSCNGPSPGFAWFNEQEYLTCVGFIVEDTGCNKQDVVDLAKCIPFDLPTEDDSPPPPPTSQPPTISPTRRPTPVPTRAPITIEPSEVPSDKPIIRQPGERSPSTGNGNDPTSEPSDFPTRRPSPLPTDVPTANPTSKSSDSCSPILLSRLAQECDCFGPRNQVQVPWAVEDEYLQCVDFAAKNTPCPVQALIDFAGCLPFPNPTPTPTLTPTIPGSAERLSTSSPSVNVDDVLISPPTVVIDVTPVINTNPPTNPPTRGPIFPPTTQAPTTLSPTTQSPTTKNNINPAAECSSAEVARVSSECNCSGRQNQKPWKHQRDYERCVKKALEQSPAACTLESFLDATRCVIFPERNGGGDDSNKKKKKRTKKNLVSAPTAPNGGNSSSNNNSNPAGPVCSQYSNENGCKTGKCKWSKKENQCQSKNSRRHRQLFYKDDQYQYHSNMIPKEETKEQHTLRASFGQVYNSVTIDESDKCHYDRESFGVPPEATLVISTPNSCRYAILQSGGTKVDVIEVLL
ncbi:unnamed protein product [Cylindrotheca closterium]|uniref:Metalloendopeptidase n=1 Tax=Cylindrotheca closterium TaxID=2856 RepID=A0AAD2CYN1_9STRA|nr:unnamed protein product [Cylindrotheca closterium]